MPSRRNISVEVGTAALRTWLDQREATGRRDLAAAVRFTLQTLADEHPGRAVELRVPPLAAVQLIPGTTHTRGTPPAVVETDPHTWLRLATGELTWHDALSAGGGVTASGERSNLSAVLPVPIARRTAAAHRTSPSGESA